MNEFPEKDWQLFKKKIVIWQETYMDKLNKEYLEILNSDKAASEKFWALEEKINNDKKDCGVICKRSRSKLLYNIQNLLDEGAITLDDLSDFSDDLKDAVKLCVGNKYAKWEDKTDTFSEKQRHYKNTYLEICEVYDNLEANLFSVDDGTYEIYVSFSPMDGIVYAKNKQEAESVRENIKKDLVAEYKKRKKPSDEFIKTFAEKYNLCLPLDTYFDFDFEKVVTELDKIWRS